MFVEVAVARPLTSTYTYAVPAHMGEVTVGHVVLVPLGSQAETGYIVDRVGTPTIDPARIKAVSRLLDPLPAFDDVQLAFFRWVADYYLVPLGLVIQTALPSQMRAKVVRVLVPAEAGLTAMTTRTEHGAALQMLQEVVARPGLTRRGLHRRLAGDLDKREADKAINALVRRGHAVWHDKELQETKGVVRTVIRTGVEAENVRGPRMRAVLASLGGESRDLAEILSEHGDAARASIDRLADQGLVAYGEREDRDTLDLDNVEAYGPAVAPPLNRDQAAALTALTAPDAAGTFLLFGVTGSGKTEVFLGASSAVLARGRQVLVLVPEIGLTPQLVGRFRARFGDQVAVLHSGLTGAERLAQWRRIRAGEARVAVGARSALFAPFQALGLVVVDEEHDDSYKQSEGVPYHARDLAVVLGRRITAPVVLASATPSLESWQNAKLGRYQILRLPERATPRPVPTIEMVDLNDVEVPEGSERPLLAPHVSQAMQETLTRGGQAIVLYNRRGYATLVACSACGASYECPNCAIAMTLHKRAGVVSCHYCALKLPYTNVCPVCEKPEMDEEGKGTERVEERLRAQFPGVVIGRMDADTTAVRGSHARILEAFRSGRTQMLIGTQIVAKGHDIPGVQCAVVISADRSLRMPDFRAAERTVALLVQLAGRAGRGDTPGRVFVQTYKPEHYALAHLGALEQFYEVELKLRSTLRYPPYHRLVLLRVDSIVRLDALRAAEGLGRALRARIAPRTGVSVLGPAPSALPRLVGRWRFQLVVRSANTQALRAFLAVVRGDLEQASKKGVRVSWDVDPRDLM